MKGMQKIIRGDGFLGVLRYAILRDAKHQECPGRILGGNLSGFNIEELAQQFKEIWKVRPDIVRPVWHNSLRLPAGEQISDSKWVQIADEYMARMGFTTEHARCYVQHDDLDGQHIHIVACRIGLSGNVFLGKNENLKSTRIISELESKYGLIPTKAPALDELNRIIMPARATPKKGELELAVRTGIASPKMRLQTIIDAALSGKPSIFQFISRLELSGVTVLPNVASTGRMNGFSYQIDSIAYKGSTLGNRYTWQTLQKEITYEQARDGTRLREIAKRATENNRRSTCPIAGSPRWIESEAVGKSANRAKSVNFEDGLESTLFASGNRQTRTRKLRRDDQSSATAVSHAEESSGGYHRPKRQAKVSRDFISKYPEGRRNLHSVLSDRRNDRPSLRPLLPPASSAPTPSEPSLSPDVRGAWRPNREGSNFWINQDDFLSGAPPAFNYEHQPYQCLKLSRSSDAAILAMLRVADDAWGGQFEVEGSIDFLERAHDLMRKHQLGIHRPRSVHIENTPDAITSGFDLGVAY